ncbi:MAG: hypothetical protein V7K92_23355 [Nostoc sp.]
MDNLFFVSPLSQNLGVINVRMCDRYSVIAFALCCFLYYQRLSRAG